MARTSPFDHDLDASRDIIADLLDMPPDEPETVEMALAELDGRAIAAAAEEALRAERPGPFDDDLFAEITRAADRYTMLRRLKHLAGDEALALDMRALAFHAAMCLEPYVAEELAETLPPEVMLTAAARTMRALVMRVELAPEEYSPELADELAEGSPDEQRMMLEAYEALRAELGTPAGLVYRGVLGHPDLEAIQPQIEALIDAVPDADAVRAMDEAAATARGAARLRYADRAAALEVAFAERPPPRPEARAWVSGADGQGAYLLSVEVRRPSGAWLPGQLCVRLPTEARSGWVNPHPGDTDPAALRAVLAETIGPWVEIPPGAAAALAARATADHCPPEAEAAAALLRRVYRPGDAPPPPVAPGEPATADALAALLSTPVGRTWFLDSDDLAALEVEPPPVEAPPAAIERWRQRALAAVVERGLHRRWVEMARQLAWWSALRGDAEGAGRLAWAAEATADDPGASPLSAVILDRTLAVFGEMDELFEAPLDLDADALEWFDPPEAPDGWRYDGWTGPAPTIWLRLDEGARMDAVRAWHLGPDSPGLCQREEDLTLQVALQAAVETQLCLDEPPTIRQALARLQQDGLDRFGAVVALQAVLSTTMVPGLSPDPAGGYAARIAAVARHGLSAVDTQLDGANRRLRGKTVKRVRKPKRAAGGKRGKGKRRKGRKRR